MRTPRFSASLFLTFIAGAIAVPAQAESPFRFGISPSLSVFAINDPIGPTDTHSGITYASALMLVDMGRDSRLMVNVSHDSFSVAPSVTNIGQDVTSTQVGASYQMVFRVTRGWKPWFGIGGGYATENYQNRNTLTPGGFKCIGCPYPDRTKDDFYVVLNTSTQWQLNRNWDMGVHLELDQPTSTDGMRAVRLGLYFVY
jgi:hypothetical protein